LRSKKVRIYESVIKLKYLSLVNDITDSIQMSYSEEEYVAAQMVVAIRETEKALQAGLLGKSAKREFVETCNGVDDENGTETGDKSHDTSDKSHETHKSRDNARDNGTDREHLPIINNSPDKRSRRTIQYDNAIPILDNWLRSNISCPYPTEQEKHDLCAKTGFTMTQINNWMSNSRRRKLKLRPRKIGRFARR
jgi:Homeobox KN domain